MRQAVAANGYVTTYAYSTFNGGTQVAATRGSQTRTSVYDALGRLVSETHPESGTTTYTYDVTPNGCAGPGSVFAGDLTSTLEANGNLSCYYYDGLHRLISSQQGSNGAVGPCQRYVYDNNAGYANPPGTVSNSLGRLREATTDNCAWPNPTPITDEWFSYSARGEVADMWQKTPHSNGYYHTTASYFPNGVPNTLGGIPGQGTFTYGVDSEGRLNSVTQGTTHFVNSVSRNLSGLPTTIAYGNGDRDNYGYDNSTNRMTNYTFTVGSTPKSMVGNLTWNANGSLQQLAITDGFNSSGTQTCTYNASGAPGYDDLGRLIRANCGAAWSQTFSYDQYDNVTKSGSLQWQPGYNSANNRYTLGGTSYDAAGNLLKDTFNAYTWAANGKLVSVIAGSTPATCGTNGVCPTYDAFGRVVELNAAGVFSQILYSPMGKTAVMNGQTMTKVYVPLPGESTLLITSAQKNVWHKDWLGTVRLASTYSNRSVSMDRAFAPFGEVYKTLSGGTANQNFTGDTQDTFAGLFDTPHRELHPQQGRWISPDPARSGWNLYAYVLNSPLMGVDPLGLGGQGIASEGGSGYGEGQSRSCLLDGIPTPCAVVQGLVNTGAASGPLPPGVGPTGSVIDSQGNSVFFLLAANSEGFYFNYLGCDAKAQGLNYCNNEGFAEARGLITFFPSPAWIAANSYPCGPLCARLRSSVGQKPEVSVRAATKLTPGQASTLCWASVQLRYNGISPGSTPSGDPGYSVDQGTNVYGPRALNPTGAGAGTTAQNAGSALALVVGKSADYQACMDAYSSSR